MDNNNTTSSSSTAGEDAQFKTDAFPPLDEASCSASSFADLDRVFDVYKKHMPEANRVAEMFENGEPDAIKACKEWITKVISEADLPEC